MQLLLFGELVSIDLTFCTYVVSLSRSIVGPIPQPPPLATYARARAVLEPHLGEMNPSSAPGRNEPQFCFPVARFHGALSTVQIWPTLHRQPRSRQTNTSLVLVPSMEDGSFYLC